MLIKDQEKLMAAVRDVLAEAATVGGPAAGAITSASISYNIDGVANALTTLRHVVAEIDARPR